MQHCDHIVQKLINQSYVSQEIIFVRNLWTDEEIIYNRVRGLRPSSLKASKEKTR